MLGIPTPVGTAQKFVMKVKGAAEPQGWVQSRVRPQCLPQFLFQHTSLRLPSAEGLQAVASCQFILLN